MKILSISFTRDLPSGIVKQLEYEFEASKSISGDSSWETILLTCAENKIPFAKRIPWIFRNIIGRYFYCWLYMLSRSRDYDYVINRYMPFDFFGVIFSFFLRKRITVHHAIEPKELLSIRKGFKGKFASLIDIYCGRIILGNVIAIMAVTDEILKFQSKRIKKEKPLLLYPNGIDLNQVELIDDKREPEKLEAIFLCQEFSPWHGLEKLLDEAEKNQKLEVINFVINLVGDLNEEQTKRIVSLKNKNIFRIHGSMSREDYLPILSKCHIGIASLALELEGLTVGCTLKVREMLGNGLPVYSNHFDSAIPKNFPYYQKVNNIYLKDICAYAEEMRFVSRGDVVKSSGPLILKSNIMKEALIFLTKLKNPN